MLLFHLFREKENNQSESACVQSVQSETEVLFEIVSRLCVCVCVCVCSLQTGGCGRWGKDRKPPRLCMTDTHTHTHTHTHRHTRWAKITLKTNGGVVRIRQNVLSLLLCWFKTLSRSRVCVCVCVRVCVCVCVCWLGRSVLLGRVDLLIILQKHTRGRTHTNMSSSQKHRRQHTR